MGEDVGRGGKEKGMEERNMRGIRRKWGKQWKRTRVWERREKRKRTVRMTATVGRGLKGWRGGGGGWGSVGWRG